MTPQYPVVILFPEIDFNEENFFKKLIRMLKSMDIALLLFQKEQNGLMEDFLAEQGTRDDFGHAQLGGAAPVVANIIKKALGYKFHWAVADYLQRAATSLSL